jgi:copper chaperone CopZ
VKFEFKLTGMTCVACSGSIERLITNEFGSKGLIEQHVGLLTHKMILSFKADAFITRKVTPEMVCSEIDDIGFGCELLSITEVSAQITEAKKRKKFRGQESDRSNSSIESEALD